MITRLLISCFVLFLMTNCNKTEIEKDECTEHPTSCGCPQAPPDCNPGENAALGNGQAGIVGISGIENWDKLSQTEKNKIKTWNSLFIHASVGANLEDGACKPPGNV